MKKKQVVVWSMVIFALAVPAAHASGTSSGTTMKRIASVRAEGMAGAHAAVVSDEAAAVGWNPACLYANRGTNLAAAYFRGVDEDSFGAVNFDIPLDNQWSAGAGLEYYDAGIMELNLGGQSSNVVAQRDLQVALTGAYHQKLYGFDAVAGANLKILHSTLVEKYSALAAAMDLGGRISRKGLPVQAGLVLRNFGTSIKYGSTENPLPGALLIGLAYDAYQHEYFSILLAGDLEYEFEDRWLTHWGAEILISDSLFLRGGYKTGVDQGSFNMGFGVRQGNYTLAYAYRPMQELNSLHSASLSYAFGEPAIMEEEEAAVPEPDYMPDVTGTGRTGSTNRTRAEILEVQKGAGRATGVVLNLGEEQGIKTGYRGTIYNAAGRPLTGMRILQVNEKISLAELIGLSREIGDDAFAVIDLPEEK